MYLHKHWPVQDLNTQFRGYTDFMPQRATMDGGHNTLYFASGKVCAKGEPFGIPCGFAFKMSACPRAKRKNATTDFIRHDVFVVGGSVQSSVIFCIL